MKINSIYMSGFMKTVLMNSSCALSGRFFPRQDGDMKIKRKISPFSLPPPVYLPFMAVLSLFFARLHGLEAA